MTTYRFFDVISITFRATYEDYKTLKDAIINNICDPLVRMQLLIVELYIVVHYDVIIN